MSIPIPRIIAPPQTLAVRSVGLDRQQLTSRDQTAYVRRLASGFASTRRASCTNHPGSMTKRSPSPTPLSTAPPAKMTTATSASLLVKRLSERATVPTRGSPAAAGYDLYSAEEKVIPARGKALIDLQLSIAVPEGTYGRVAPRSGLASKHSIDTGAGVIDADYRGPVMVLLFNLSDVDFTVKAGDRVAQLILEKIETAPVLEVEDLDATVRGAGGFGSTGGFGASVAAVASAVGDAAVAAGNAAKQATERAAGSA